MLSEEWRLIPFTSNDAAMNMAIDEAVLRARAEGRAPNTVRLYSWRPSAVSIGFFQSVEDEVDVESCSASGVSVVRRITGGGAVYHDEEGEVTYSIVVGENDPVVEFSILDSYKVFCGGVVEGLDSLGLKAEFRPVNDIMVNDRKISGNAQTRRMDVVLQHGTILVDVDVKKMFSVLRVSDEKIRDKLISAVEERVTSVNRELGGKVSLSDVALALKRGFERALGVRLIEGVLSDEEVTAAGKLRMEKYGSKTWVFSR